MTLRILAILTLALGSFSLSAQIAERAEDISPLLIGENIPNTQLIASDGSRHSVLNILSRKPTVILFYRGGWCPYCNAHLSDVREAEEQIIELGYQIIAISPDSPENLVHTGEKNELNYELFSDADGTFMKAMGVAFMAKERNLEKLMRYSDGANTGFLPVPSVFITNTSGMILFEYINPSYKTRMSSRLLLAVLKNLD
jgi:peroxiredoxin